jgi:tetratricopeptide (TPR) repeat protein
MDRAPHRWLALGVAALLAANPCASAELRDLYYGEALFEADQGQFFDALVRLDTELAQHYGLDEPDLDTLHYHVNGAEFSVGDFELNYRMHNRAGRAIRAVLEGNVDEAVRNEAAFRLARIHFQKDQLEEALHALARIQGEVPEEIRDDVEFLRANVYLASGRPHDAVAVLKHMPESADLAGFSAYNLGIALLQDGDATHAIEQLDRAGQTKARERADLAIRDKSNLVLGTMLFESADFARAEQTFDRVRLDGPVFEPGITARRLGGGIRRTLRPGPRSVGNPGRTRAHGFRRAGSHARLPARLCGARGARPRRNAIRPRARILERRDRQGRCVDRGHPRWRVPDGADRARRRARTAIGSCGSGSCPTLRRPST